MATFDQQVRVAKTNAISFDASSMFTIRVGTKPNQKEFLAHEAILASRSEFFRKAMKVDWLEAELRKVDLPEDLPEIFQLYLHQVYTGRLPTCALDEGKIDGLLLAEFHDHLAEEYALLVEVYLLAEKLQDIAAKNGIITAIVELTRVKSVFGEYSVPPTNSVAAIYEETPEGSPARRLVVDLWSSLPFCISFKEFPYMPQSFLDDLASTLDNEWGSRHNNKHIALPKGVAHYLEKEGSYRVRQ